MRSALIKAAILAMAVVATSRIFAADKVAEAEMDQLKRDAKAVGREFAREGNRIADDAVDIAETIADNFVEAYDETKEDLRNR